MTLVRWNPWADLDGLQGDVDRYFTNRAAATPQSAFLAAADVHEDEKGYSLDFDLPGVKLQDVDIELHEGTLTVGGERKLERSEQSDGYRRVERRHGTFSRSFRLPKHVDEVNIEASMKDGVLTIRLPKVEAVHPRKIAISA